MDRVAVHGEAAGRAAVQVDHADRAAGHAGENDNSATRARRMGFCGTKPSEQAMSEVDAILKELDALLTQAVGVADQTAAKLQRAAEEREIVAERGETHDLRDAAHRIRLQLRDAQGFLATRRAHAPLVDIETGELPNALANVRSLAANLADEQYDVDTSDRLEKTRATIDSLGQIVYHVDRCCGPHGSGSGPRGRPKWGVTIDDVSQLPNFGRTTPPRGLTDSES